MKMPPITKRRRDARVFSTDDLARAEIRRWKKRGLLMLMKEHPWHRGHYVVKIEQYHGHAKPESLGYLARSSSFAPA